MKGRPALQLGVSVCTEVLRRIFVDLVVLTGGGALDQGNGEVEYGAECGQEAVTLGLAPADLRIRKAGENAG